jgi:hypothetical protein
MECIEVGQDRAAFVVLRWKEGEVECDDAREAEPPETWVEGAGAQLLDRETIIQARIGPFYHTYKFRA